MFLDDIVGPMGIEEAKKLSGADKFRKTISDIETKHKPGEEHYNRLKSDPAYREQEFQKWQKEVHGDKQVEEGDLMRAAWEKSKQSMPVGHKPGWALDPKTKQELLRRQTVQQRRGVDEAELWTSDKNNWGGEDPWSTGHNEWESGTDNAWSDGNQWASEGVGPESNPADSASAIPGTPGLDTGIIEDRLHVGDPVIVTAPNAYEGKTGEIAEFSPSGRFVIVRLYNGGECSMHLSDVEYNQYADDEDADEYGEYEHELDEFAPGGTMKPPVAPTKKGDPFEDDNRSQILKSIQQLLAKGATVDSYLFGARGHIDSVTDDFYGFRFKRKGRPGGAIRPMDGTDDDEYMLKMVKPGHYELWDKSIANAGEQGVAEGDDLTHAGQDVMVWTGPPTANPPKDDKQYWIRGKLDSTEKHGGAMRANVMTANGMYNPELSRVFNVSIEEGDLEEMDRRGFLKAAGAAVGTAALGGLAGCGVSDKEKEFLSHLTDPADVKKYKELRNQWIEYRALSVGKGGFQYEGLATITFVDLEKFKKQMYEKYNFGPAKKEVKEAGVAEVKQRLDAKCWAGKHKEGTKIKGGVRVNNCVPNESVTESYWTRLQNEKNTRLNSLVNELSESVKKIK